MVNREYLYTQAGSSNHEMDRKFGWNEKYAAQEADECTVYALVQLSKI